MTAAAIAILIFSQLAADQPIHWPSDHDSNQAARPIQNTILVCDARDGRRYRASTFYPDREAAKSFNWSDAIEEAEIPESKMIFLEYTTGPANNVQSQAENLGLTKQELSRCLEREDKK